MNISIASIRAEAVALGHSAESEVIKFIDLLEGKQARIAASKAELVAAGYSVTDPVA
jgi:hypothetical protein